MIHIEDSLYKRLKEITSNDKRYHMQGYIFVLQALDFTIERIAKEKRHVSGRELCLGIKELAAKEFGGLAKMTLNMWGIYETLDIGHIVFNMVESGLMGKTDQDKLDDFREVYNFDEAFSMVDN